MKKFVRQPEPYEFGNGWGLFIDIENTNNNLYQKKQHVYINNKCFIGTDFYKINVNEEIKKDKKNIKNNNILYNFKNIILKYNCNPFYLNKINVYFVVCIIIALSIY